MTDKFKKTLLFDLDGVLNTYDGNYDKNFISPIKDGAYKLLKELSEDYNLSPSRITRIIQNGLEKVRNELKKQCLV